MLKNGKSIFEILKHIGINGHNDQILSKINKNSKLSIPHWQCREEPGYRLMYFESDGRLMVGGNAGSWSGPYSSYVRIEDLIRYAKDKNSIL